MKYAKPNVAELTHEQLVSLVKDISARLFCYNGSWSPTIYESDHIAKVCRDDIAEMLINAGAGPRKLIRTVNMVMLHDLCKDASSYETLRSAFLYHHDGGTITKAEFKNLLYVVDPKRDTDGVTVHADMDLLNECDLVEFS